MAANESAGAPEKRKYFEQLLGGMIENSSQTIKPYVEKLRSQNKELDDLSLAKKIVSRKSFKNGLLGALTGMGGVVLLPVVVPIDVAYSYRIQIGMALAVAEVFGVSRNNSDLKTDIYLILLGDGAKEALKRAGIEVSKGGSKKIVQKHITREVMKKIWRHVPQKVITKAGAKSLTSFMKLIPLVGAPVGFTFDWLAARAVGRMAIRYYSGGG